ncbi:MAG: LuxR C-terminal-related transcriptional regulator [Firmicutes bacterium]|nr:LuxR C-terminal-related transcriptional regulator [Bacillota bacterium]
MKTQNTANKKTVERVNRSTAVPKTATTTADANTPPTTPPKTANAPNKGRKVTAKNVQNIGEGIATKALKTIYQKSADNFIRRLYCDLLNDINARKNNIAENLSDSYDIAQTAILFLIPYIGKKLDSKAGNGETDKDGKGISILRATFRAVNRYIMGQRKAEFNRVYLEDNGQYFEIPKYFDAQTISELNLIYSAVRNLELTERQDKVLHYRLQGKGVREIARICGVNPKSTQETLKQIQKKMPIEYQQKAEKVRHSGYDKSGKRNTFAPYIPPTPPLTIDGSEFLMPFDIKYIPPKVKAIKGKATAKLTAQGQKLVNAMKREFDLIQATSQDLTLAEFYAK